VDDNKFDSEDGGEEQEVLGELPGLRMEMAKYEEFLIRRRWEIENVQEDDEGKSESGSQSKSQSKSEKGESVAGEDAKSMGNNKEGAAGPSDSMGLMNEKRFSCCFFLFIKVFPASISVNK
jgi:hypothetical protein